MRRVRAPSCRLSLLHDLRQLRKTFRGAGEEIGYARFQAGFKPLVVRLKVMQPGEEGEVNHVPAIDETAGPDAFRQAGYLFRCEACGEVSNNAHDLSFVASLAQQRGPSVAKAVSVQFVD